MARILVLYAHPRSDRSENTIRMAERAAATDGVTLVDLYAEYPDFDIDVDQEQQRLIDHDILIFLHPVYWYSSPALLKEWQDLVLVHDFAYGKKGDKLKGKLFLQAVTCGGGSEAYGESGETGLSLAEIFAPFNRMARHCHMDALPPFALFRAGHSVEENRRDGHVLAFEKLLISLRDDCLDLEAARQSDDLCHHLDQLVHLPGDA